MSTELQRIFDTVCDHLVDQGERSEGRFGGCRYRGPEGLRCAVGVLIDDEKYREWMEGVPSDSGTAIISAISASGYPEASTEAGRRLIRNLQKIHDMVDVPNWQRSLRAVARRYGLQEPASIQDE